MLTGREGVAVCIRVAGVAVFLGIVVLRNGTYLTTRIDGAAICVCVAAVCIVVTASTAAAIISAAAAAIVVIIIIVAASVVVVVV